METFFVSALTKYHDKLQTDEKRRKENRERSDYLNP